MPETPDHKTIAERRSFLRGVGGLAAVGSLDVLQAAVTQENGGSSSQKSVQLGDEDILLSVRSETLLSIIRRKIRLQNSDTLSLLYELSETSDPCTWKAITDLLITRGVPLPESEEARQIQMDCRNAHQPEEALRHFRPQLQSSSMQRSKNASTFRETLRRQFIGTMMHDLLKTKRHEEETTS